MNSQDYLCLVGIGIASFVLSFFGAAVGMVLGHLRLPMFVAYLGSPVLGASTNLAVSGLGALASSIQHFRGGRVSFRALLLVGLPSVVGAIGGVFLFVKFNRVWAMLVLGVLLVVLGTRMLRQKTPAVEQEAEDEGVWKHLTQVLLGVFLGALAAITGLMMNSLRLPLLVRLLGGDLHRAVGTNMAIGLLTAVTGVLSAVFLGGGFDCLSIVIVGPPTILGSYLGVSWANRISKSAFKKLLGWMIAILGVLMILEAVWKGSRPIEVEQLPSVIVERNELEEEPDDWFEELDWMQ